MKITINSIPQKIYPKVKDLSNTYNNNMESSSIRHGMIYNKKNAKEINNLSSSIGFVILTPINNFISKSSPIFDTNLKMVKDFVMKKIHEIRKLSEFSDEDIRPIIFGGLASDSENPLANKSCELVNTLEEACLLENVPPVIITGQYANAPDMTVNSNIGNSRITLWGKTIDQLQTSRRTTHEEMIEELENIMEYVKIPDNTDLRSVEDLSILTHKSNSRYL